MPSKKGLAIVIEISAQYRMTSRALSAPAVAGSSPKARSTDDEADPGTVDAEPLGW